MSIKDMIKSGVKEFLKEEEGPTIQADPLAFAEVTLHNRIADLENRVKYLEKELEYFLYYFRDNYDSSSRYFQDRKGKHD